MSIAERMRQLRAELPECKIVLLGDLSSEVVLCVETYRRKPQEKMDAYCVAASQLLRGSEMERIPALLGTDACLSEAIIVADTGTHLMMTSADGVNDVMCLSGSKDMDIAASMISLRSSLIEIGSEP